ncbi:ribulose-phosphate 3-epimerase [Candidatus Woesearchaeota archaeon]|nr:ribulose-phosphate 3-epimerase [Candidatus Woesearchaeota archaeon]
MKVKIAPSILSADFSNLQKDVDKVKNADYLHIDVMDGHFVPNITIGPVVIENIKTKLVRDVHLMIMDPEKYAKGFAKAGADIITFHAETTKNIKKTVKTIKKLKVKVGVAINPNKSLSLIKPIINDVDMVLLMTVFPGFGDQSFISSVLKKVKQLRKLKPKLDIQVDGGIDDKTIKQAVKTGANVIVAGSFIFGSKNPKKTVELLRKSAKDI